jgi:tetratricopeptide (TPR) repeat protein
MTTKSLRQSDGLSGRDMYNTSLALRRQYRQDRSNKDLLAQYIDLAHKAVAHASKVSPGVQAARLYHLGVVLQDKYLETRIGSVSHIEAAIEYMERSLKITPSNARLSLKARRLAGTGRAWGWRYQAARDSKDRTVSQVYFDKAKTYFERVIDAQREEPSLQAPVLEDLAILFRDRYYETKGDITNSLSDLHDSSSYLESALEQIPTTSEAHK